MARPILGRHLRAANDNAEAWSGSASQQQAVLEAALRLFAAHGFAAAERARDAALIAGANADAERADFWRAVCHTLDRRLMRDLVRQR
ncbi:MAG: hypothetical protein ACK4UL_08930 [Novosphingobium meiothermophilum]|uniref:hypothetical protein n=1 Tax=Novosphingobium TaxID=165696 RepID=UPI000D6E4F46|nr:MULTISPECIES: hypothetical protein [Novosphingobium]